MLKNSGKESMFRPIMAVLIITALIPMVSTATDLNESGNGSVILCDALEETLSLSKENISTAAPSPTMTMPLVTKVESGLSEAEAASDTISLHQNAVNQAKKLVGTSYLWGGKGFDYQTMKYADAETVASAYTYYDPVTGTNKVGKGVDCSGLVMWSYNKAYGATKFKDSSNPVYYEGAAGQWGGDSTRFQQKSTSVPNLLNLAVGDLLFIGTTVAHTPPDHVGMYIGNGNVIHSKGYATVEIKTLNDWLNLPVDSSRKYRECFTGYGSVITDVSSGSVTFSIGDTVEVQNTLTVGLVIRSSPLLERRPERCMMELKVQSLMGQEVLLQED
ncbi:C40 family peptidase [Methanogenium cariaci]|uniref:C40 family peptidase n=1 Tax=Methanogenium cariaci TaxID=2197 RepID=UPI0012F67C6A|nr:NlpC/P60 family protein [Methanogenium cariaci]